MPASKKTTEEKNVATKEVVEEKINKLKPVTFNSSKRMKVLNLCPWDVSFTLPNSGKEVIIEANKKITISGDELSVMADSNDTMLCGIADGNHARLYVEDEGFRQYAMFDIVGDDNEGIEEKIQYVLTDDNCKAIMDTDNQEQFENEVKSKIVCNHEKAIIMNYCRKNRNYNYDKIDFLERYTGLKM